MPFASLKSIYSVSSEDPVHCASNLLKSDHSKKWKTLSNGEKSASITLQLENSGTITGIDVGNEHSAFIGVLVGKVGQGPDEFKEILLTSSFMTPIESKNSTNINRIRCFHPNHDSWIKSVAEEKWDLIKFVCSQPFNKHVQYGLSLIKVHVSESKDSKCLVPPKFLEQQRKLSQDCKSPSESIENKFLGKFKLRSDSTDSEEENTTSLFNRWKQKTKTPDNDKSKTAAASIRDASKFNNELSSTSKWKMTQKNENTPKNKKDDSEKRPTLDRNRNDLFFNKDDERNDKLEQQILKDKERVTKERNNLDKSKKTSKDKSSEKFSLKDSKTEKSPAKKALKDFTFSSKFKNLFGDDEDEPKVKIKNSSSNTEKVKTPRENSPALTTNSFYNKRPSSSPNRPQQPAKKIRHEKDFSYKPFNKLLEGVVLVISGIQNPDRADLRNKALALGAKYKPDWDSSCTHLICAFKNTPKYNQVKDANGKIVKRTWIAKCHQLKKRLPWRRYALDPDDESRSESEEEILDISMKPRSESPDSVSEDVRPDKTNSASFLTGFEPTSTSNNNKPEKSYDEISVLYDVTDNNDKMIQIDSSGSDTEEEIEKIRKNQMSKGTILSEAEKQASPKQKSKSSELKTTSPKENVSPTKFQQKCHIPEQEEVDPFEVSTDEDEFTKSKKPKLLSKTKTFFQNLKFYLNPRLSVVDKNKLMHIIEVFHGVICKFVVEANYAISNENLETSSSFKGETVKPLWIYECNDMECLIPTKRYLI